MAVPISRTVSMVASLRLRLLCLGAERGVGSVSHRGFSCCRRLKRGGRTSRAWYVNQEDWLKGAYALSGSDAANFFAEEVCSAVLYTPAGQREMQRLPMGSEEPFL